MKHTPSDYVRGRVSGLAQAGLPQEKIASVLGLTLHCLRRNYLDELETAMANRVAEVANRLFMQAVSDKDTRANTIARLFIMKFQAHWKEVHTLENPTTRMVVQSKPNDPNFCPWRILPLDRVKARSLLGTGSGEVPHCDGEDGRTRSGAGP